MEGLVEVPYTGLQQARDREAKHRLGRSGSYEDHRAHSELKVLRFIEMNIHTSV